MQRLFQLYIPFIRLLPLMISLISVSCAGLPCRDDSQHKVSLKLVQKVWVKNVGWITSGEIWLYNQGNYLWELRELTKESKVYRHTSGSIPPDLLAEVNRYIKSGELHDVDGTPVFSYGIDDNMGYKPIAIKHFIDWIFKHAAKDKSN